MTYEEVFAALPKFVALRNDEDRFYLRLSADDPDREGPDWKADYECLETTLDEMIQREELGLSEDFDLFGVGDTPLEALEGLLKSLRVFEAAKRAV